MKLKHLHLVTVLAASTMVVGCGTAQPAPAPTAPQSGVATQTQALVASAPGVYELSFEQSAASPASLPAPALDLMGLPQRLSVTQGDGELLVELSNSKIALSGTADEIDDSRWIAGLAGVFSGSGAPLVMRMTAEHAGDKLIGNVIVDSDGVNYMATFAATRAAAAPPAKPAAPAAAGASDEGTSTFYHLPGGAFGGAR